MKYNRHTVHPACFLQMYIFTVGFISDTTVEVVLTTAVQLYSKPSAININVLLFYIYALFKNVFHSSFLVWILNILLKLLRIQNEITKFQLAT